MRIRDLLLYAALLAASATPVSAAMRISDDRGGQIGHYLQAFTTLRSSGQRVIVDGSCLSACTLVLGMIPPSRLCATDRARFGFHAAWMPDRDGNPVTSKLGTRALWNIYPSSVRHWINRHGGLSRKMIFLEGRDLEGIVPSCNEVAHRARASSRNRVAHRPPRYVTGSASAYRR
jgi:hypothetical protein